MVSYSFSIFRDAIEYFIGEGGVFLKPNKIKLIGASLLLLTLSSTQLFAATVESNKNQVQSAISFTPYTMPVGAIYINPDDLYDNSRYKIAEGETFIKKEGLYIYGVSYEPLATSFKDVEESHWGNKAIQNIIRKGYLPGMQEDLFFPNEPLMRSQAFQSLDRCLLRNGKYQAAYSRQVIDKSMEKLDPYNWSKYSAASVFSKIALEERTYFTTKDNLYDGMLTKRDALTLVYGLLKFKDPQICEIEDITENTDERLLLYAKYKEILPEQELLQLDKPITKVQWTYILNQLDLIL